MKEQLKQLKENLESINAIIEGQESSTRYDQESKESKEESKVETPKSFEEDRLNLEEILSQPSSYKKNYIKKVVNAVNKLIDGTSDIDDLTKTIKGKKKRNCNK